MLTVPKGAVDRNKDYQAALADWRGAQGRLESYVTCDICRCLSILLESEDRKGNLQIVVHDPYVIQMPAVWFDADIEYFESVEMERRFREPISLLIDRKAGVRIVCLGATFWENAESSDRRIWPKDFAPVLDQYKRVWREYKV